MEKVGEIEGYDVIYVPEKDVIFCKNTTVKYPVIERIVRSSMSRERIEEKNLTVIKNEFWVTFGCLNTTTDNCKSIMKNVSNIKKSFRQNGKGKINS